MPLKRYCETARQKDMPCPRSYQWFSGTGKVTCWGDDIEKYCNHIINIAYHTCPCCGKEIEEE